MNYTQQKTKLIVYSYDKNCQIDI